MNYPSQTPEENEDDKSVIVDPATPEGQRVIEERRELREGLRQLNIQTAVRSAQKETDD